MSANYKYLHSVVSGIYQDLEVPKSEAVPSELSAEVRRHATVFNATSVGLSEIFSYFVVPDSAGTPNLFFSKVAAKENSTSEGYYSQCAGWKINSVYRLPAGAKLPTDNFNSIFDFAFYTENEVDAYAQKKSTPSFGNGSASIPAATPIAIAPEAIRAILYAVVARWKSGYAPVYVEVPAGVNYNAYVMAAVKQIYSYFPVGLKLNAGFCSYVSTENITNYKHFSIVFVPSSKTNNQAIRLDGSSAMAYKAYTRISQGAKMNAFLDYLAGLQDETARKTFLETVLIDAEYSAAEDKIGTVRATRYAVLGEGIRLLNATGTAREQFPLWLDFIKNEGAFPKATAEKIRQYIDQHLQPVDFTQILADEAAMPSPADIQSLEATLTDLLNLCNKRKELLSVLWNYVEACLKRIFPSDDACFQWLLHNEAMLAGHFGSEAVNRFKQELIARCTGSIKEKTRKVIADTKISKWKEYEKTVKETLNQAETAMAQYGDSSEWRKSMEAIANNRINSYVASHLDKVETEVLSKDIDSGEKYLDYVREKVKKASANAGGYGDSANWQNRVIDRAYNRIANNISAELEEQKQANPSNADQYKKAIRDCENLLKNLPAIGVNARSDAARTQVQEYLNGLYKEHEQLANSVSALVDSFGYRYFHALDKYAARKDTLTDNQRADVTESLRELRPHRLRDYLETYQNETGNTLNAAELARTDLAISELVCRDLKELLGKPIDVNIAGRPSGEIVAETGLYIALAEVFGAGKVTVNALLPGYDDTFSNPGTFVEMDAAVLRDLASFNLDKKNAGSLDEASVQSVVNVLRENNPGHDYALAEMLFRCGYKNAAAEMFDSTGETDDEESKKLLLGQLKASGNQGNKSGKLKDILIYVLGGLCLILLVLVILLLIKQGASSPEETTPSTSESTIAETEPVETQPVETESTETVPEETDSTEIDPTATDPSETEPSETEPAETEPAETEPAETEPAETEPAETEPAETEPAETEPAETEPAETEPAEIESTETQPA